MTVGASFCSVMHRMLSLSVPTAGLNVFYGGLKRFGLFCWRRERHYSGSIFTPLTCTIETSRHISQMKCCSDKCFLCYPAPIFVDSKYISIYRKILFPSVKTDTNISTHSLCGSQTTECTINCSGSTHTTSIARAGQLGLCG